MNAMTKPAPPDLRLTPPTAAPIVDRGRAMLPAEVAREIFDGKVSARWVLDNAPLQLRGKFGRKIVFKESAMIAWRDSLFGGGR
jgi:hypothetical protein